MLEAYISETHLNKILLEHKIPEMYLHGNCIGITSISDLIQVMESYRKSNTKEYSDIFVKCKDYYEKGYIHIADLDHNSISSNLFDDEIWERFGGTGSNPLDIIRYVSLKNTDDSVWWSEEIYIQMTELHE